MTTKKRVYIQIELNIHLLYPPGRYQVRVAHKGKPLYIGTFETLQEARDARQRFRSTHSIGRPGSPRGTRAISPIELQELVVLAPIHGITTLALRYGVPRNTLRTIMHRHGISGPGVGYGDNHTGDCPWYWKAILEDSPQ